jgi:predicted nucleic acid-binding protein
MLIVADTSPLNYLVILRSEHILPALYGNIIIPPLVLRELRSEGGEDRVRAWASTPPAWLLIREPTAADHSWPIDPGEAAAIALARELKADRLLMDDSDGRALAESLGLKVAGTLAVLRDAAMEGLVDLKKVLDDLRQTTFRASPKLYDQMLEEYANREPRQP